MADLAAAKSSVPRADAAPGKSAAGPAITPEERARAIEFTGAVERLRDLTHDIKELRIRLIHPRAIEFVAGQYIQLEAPGYGDNPEPFYRDYSIASPPSDREAIELIIRLVPGGACTTWVFNVLKEGDTVRLRGPFGQFRLSGRGCPMIWVAGGVGLAPFWSLGRHMDEHRIRRPCTFFFGTVRRRDLFLVDEFRRIERDLPGFQFIPALSGPPEDDGWTGERGLITHIVGRHVADGSDQEGYLCGSPGLIDATIKVLKAKGITEGRIFYDKFT